MDVEIIKGNLNHIPAINEILNQAITEKKNAYINLFTIEDQQKWFKKHSNPRFPVLIAQSNNIIKGWLSISPYRSGRGALYKTAEISFYIHKNYRRQGIGKILLKKAEKLAANLNFQTYIAILLDNNIGSLCLLTNTGYSKWGHLSKVVQFEKEIIGQYYYGKNLFQ